MEKRLLIVDDCQEITDVISTILGDLFDVVENACTVDAAENFLVKNTYLLIILDINLSGRNGAEVCKFVHETPGNSNQNTPFVIISGFANPQFIERNQKKFCRIFMKPFDHDELRKVAQDIVFPVRIEENVPELSLGLDEDIVVAKCDLPFTIVKLQQTVDKMLEQVKKNARLKKLFSQMNIDRSGDNYIATHTGLLINISTAISIQMQWSTDKMLEKFVYAAYLHDVALANRPDLARINTIEKLAAAKDTLSAHDYKLIFEHPNIGANTIEDLSDIPPEVGIMIRQHHELPKETGYPLKSGHQKIVPLSVVFIIAHDLADYIIINPKWNVEDYCRGVHSKFVGSQFTKVLRTIATLK